MSGAKTYTLRRPLGFGDVIQTARLAVREAYAAPPERAAAVVQMQARAILPAYARDDVDGWVPRSEEDWIRKGAYCGLIDAWTRADWRAAQGPPTADAELYAGAYTIAWSAVSYEVTRQQAQRDAAQEVR